MNYTHASTNIGLVSILSLILVISVCVGQSSAQEHAVISFAPSKPLINLHEPVFVALSVKNGLSEEVQIDLGFNRKSKFDIMITDPNASRVKVPRLGEEGFGIDGKILVQPGKTYVQILLLDGWYEFAKSGTYQVEISLVNQLRIQSGAPVNAKTSGKFTLQVGPRDVYKLTKVCEELTRMAVDPAASAEKATEAAAALAYVRDPVAVPFLAELLDDGPFSKPYAIYGLGRIGDIEAVETLIGALKIEDLELRSLIRRALREIETRSNDPMLKKRIVNAIDR